MRFKLVILFAWLLPLTLSAQNAVDTLDRPMRYIAEVTATGSRVETDVRQLPMTVDIISREAIEMSHEMSLLSSISEAVPGLYVTQRGVLGYGVSTGGAGQITVRGIGGSPTTGVLVLIDGHPQYQGLLGHSIADQYQSMMAERVEILRGPASVLYGSNAMGGVINIVTRKATTDGNTLNASVSGGSYATVQAEVSDRLRVKRFGASVAGSYGRTDGHRDGMDFKQGGGFAKLTFDINDKWNTWADVDITKFNSLNPGPASNPYTDYEMTILRGTASAGLSNRHDKTQGALSLFSNWGDHTINDGYQAGGSPQQYLFRSKDQLIGFDLYQTMMLFPGNMLTVGANFQRMGGHAWNDYIDSDEEAELADVHETDVALYAEMRHDFWGVLTADIGLRVDHHSKVGTELVPQFGLSWHACKSADLRLMCAKGFRNPTLKELYMFVPQNPDLEPERLMNYELSWSQRALEDRLKWGLNLFYIDGTNMISTTLVDGKKKNVNIGEVENMGVEIQGQMRVAGAVTVGANYTFLSMASPILSVPEHKLNLFVAYRKGGFSATTNVQFVGGLYTDISEPVQETFVVWNADVEYAIGRRFGVFARLDNILGAEYEMLADYPMAGMTCYVGVKFR